MNDDNFAGWIAFYNNKRIEIKKTEANDLWGAKQLAVKLLKVPKYDIGYLAIAPAYNDTGEII